MVAEPSLLSVKGLCFERDDILVIDSVCLDLSDGEILQIEGPNGSGKTTLLRLLISALAPTHGDIYYRGARLSECRFEYLSNLLFFGPSISGQNDVDARRKSQLDDRLLNNLRGAFGCFG